MRPSQFIPRRSLSCFYSAGASSAWQSYPPLSFYRLSQPPEVANGSFRFRKSSSRAPSDGAQLDCRLSVRAATTAVTRCARGNWDDVGADGCRHGRFNDPFHTRLRPHRPTIIEWNRPSRILGSSPKVPYYRAPKSADDPLIGVAHMIAGTVVAICGSTIVLGCAGNRAPGEFVPVSLRVYQPMSGGC